MGHRGPLHPPNQITKQDQETKAQGTSDKSKATQQENTTGPRVCTCRAHLFVWGPLCPTRSSPLGSNPTLPPGVWALTHHWCLRPPDLPSARSRAQVFVWLGLQLFVPVSIGTASLLRPSQLPSPRLAVPWPGPSRQLAMFQSSRHGHGIATEGTACTKALRRGHAWPGMWRLVRLQQRGEGESRRSEGQQEARGTRLPALNPGSSPEPRGVISLPVIQTEAEVGESNHLFKGRW